MKFSVAIISALICSLSSAPVGEAEPQQLNRRTLGLLAGLLGGYGYGYGGRYNYAPKTDSVNVNINNALSSSYQGSGYTKYPGGGYYNGYYPGYYPGSGPGGYPYGGPQYGYAQRSNVDATEGEKKEEAPAA